MVCAAAQSPGRLAVLLMTGLLGPAAATAQGPLPSGPIRQVVGNHLIYVLRADGSVLGFGLEHGTLGARQGPSNTDQPTLTPFVLSLPGKVTQMAAGTAATYALMEDGSLYAWGNNDRGEFGRGPGATRTPGNPLKSFTPIKVPIQGEVVRIVAAGAHALALRADGTVLAWGEFPGTTLGEKGVEPVPGLAGVVDLAASRDHFIALTKEGFVYGLGENQGGRLGLPPETYRSGTPVKIAGLDRVVSIGAASTGSFGYNGAVRADGTVWMWGSNMSATMGNGLRYGEPGPHGNDNAVPAVVKGITTAKSISTGDGHVAVLLADGTLRLWGHDGWGQIGVGTAGYYHESPKKPAIAEVAGVYLVGSKTFAVKRDGTLWRWGPALAVSREELGHDRRVPTQIPLP